jgi:hypothetical protein
MQKQKISAQEVSLATATEYNSDFPLSLADNYFSSENRGAKKLDRQKGLDNDPRIGDAAGEQKSDEPRESA